MPSIAISRAARALALGLIIASLLPSPEVAARSLKRPQAAVLSLFEKGLAALEAKDLVTAKRLLSDAYRASPRPDLLYQLGRVAAAEGKQLLAYDLFRRYLADPARGGDDAASQVAEQALSQPAPENGTLSIQSEPGALVIADDNVVGILPLALPLLLAPGQHSVRLEFPDKKIDAEAKVEPSRLTEVRISRGSGAVLVSILPAILLCEEQTDVPAEAGRVFAEALEVAARGEHHTMLRMDSLLPQAKERGDCLAKESCQRELADKHKTPFILKQRTRAQKGAQNPSWTIELRLLRADVKDPASVADLSCADCPPAQAAARLKEAAVKLLSDGLFRPRAAVSITTEPAGATLRIGDAPPVSAPYRQVLWAGSYEVTASQSRYKNEQRTLEVADGKDQDVVIKLEKIEQQAPPPLPPAVQRFENGPRPRWRLAVGGTLLAVGLGLSAAGVAGLAINGTCFSQPEVEDGVCRDIYMTRTPGGVSLGIGLAAIGSGVVLIALPGPRRLVPQDAAKGAGK